MVVDFDIDDDHVEMQDAVVGWMIMQRMVTMMLEYNAAVIPSLALCV